MEFSNSLLNHFESKTTIGTVQLNWLVITIDHLYNWLQKRFIMLKH